MSDGPTFGSGVMSGLIIGTSLRQSPGKLMGTVAARVTLEVVVEINNGVACMRTQNLGKSHMIELLTLVRHGGV